MTGGLKGRGWLSQVIVYVKQPSMDPGFNKSDQMSRERAAQADRIQKSIIYLFIYIYIYIYIYLNMYVPTWNWCSAV
jgi:hypothetical protein